MRSLNLLENVLFVSDWSTSLLLVNDERNGKSNSVGFDMSGPALVCDEEMASVGFAKYERSVLDASWPRYGEYDVDVDGGSADATVEVGDKPKAFDCASKLCDGDCTRSGATDDTSLLGGGTGWSVVVFVWRDDLAGNDCCSLADKNR